MKQTTFLFLLTIILCISCKTTDSKTQNSRKVKCEVAQKTSNATNSSLFTGRISAAAEVNIGFRIAGVIDKIKVQEGDFVRKGEVIAVMDKRDYKLQLAATQAEYASIKGEVDRVCALYKDNGVTLNDYEKATNGLKQMESKLAAHTNALSDTELRAPFDGYIQKIMFDSSEAVAAGMPVISIISNDTPELIINLPAIDYINIDSLEAATATITHYKELEFSLRLIGVTHKSNLNQLYSARFAIEPSCGTTPKVGLTATAKLKYNTAIKDAICVPLSAIVEKENKTFVWILNGGKVSLHEVLVSDINTSGIAVIEQGINQGDVVVTAGAHSLKEGQKVEALPQLTTSNIGGIL